MPIKKIEDPIYGIDIHFIFDVEYDAALKYMRKFENIYDLTTFSHHWEKAGFVYCEASSDAIIIFPKRCKTWSYTTILAHEALHVTCSVMRRKGVVLCCESEEAYTYYLTWIMQKLTDIYESHYKKGRKNAR